MPTPSPPKRSPNFGQKDRHAATADNFEFHLEDSEGPFAPASPQTTPPQQFSQSSGKVTAKKKKKVKVIEPFAA